MNLSAIQNVKSAEQRLAEDNAKRAVAHANSGLAFRKVAPTTQAAIVAKAREAHAPVKSVALGTPAQAPAAGSLNAVAAVAKAFTDGIAAMTAAIRGPAQTQKAAPAPQPAAAPTAAPVDFNTGLVSAEKRARTAEIAGQAQTASRKEPYAPLETAGQRRRSQQDAVAAQRSIENAAADRVLVSKGGAKVLAQRALDPSLSASALHALTHILGKWNEAGRRPVRVRASGVSDGTGMSLANAQAALDELEAKNAVIASVNSAGIRLIQPGLGVARVADGAQS